jgi:hypothetical protein
MIKLTFASAFWAAKSSYLLYIHHDKTVNFRILLLIETAISQRHVCGCCAAGRGLNAIVFLGFVADGRGIEKGNLPVSYCRVS